VQESSWSADLATGESFAAVYRFLLFFGVLLGVFAASFFRSTGQQQQPVSQRSLIIFIIELIIEPSLIIFIMFCIMSKGP